MTLDASREAASAGDIAFYERLRDRGGDLNDGGWTPLHVLVRYPFARGADVNAPDALDGAPSDRQRSRAADRSKFEGGEKILLARVLTAT